MTYSVFFDSEALDFVGRLPTGDFQRVRDAIATLSQDPRPPGSFCLLAQDSWHLRVGKYRVVYLIDDEEQSIAVMYISHVRDTYQ